MNNYLFIRKYFSKNLWFLFFILPIFLCSLALSCSKKESTEPETFEYPESNLSFSMHIHPIFIQDCTDISGCHQSNNPAAGLDLATTTPTFVSNKRQVVFPNDADNSPLYRVLLDNYLDMPRMPYLRAQLPNEKIKAIKTWINEGANINY